MLSDKSTSHYATKIVKLDAQQKTAVAEYFATAAEVNQRG
jgi:hypothetical protein